MAQLKTGSTVGGLAILTTGDLVLLDTILVLASSMIPLVTNGAELGTMEYVTNDVMRDYLDFDQGTEEFAAFNIVMPENWNLGTIKVKFLWAPATSSGSVGDTVEWKITGSAISDGDAIDTAYGTAQVIQDAVLTGENATEHTTGATPALTVGGTPTLHDLIQFKVSRNVSNDNHGYDARLFGVLIQYTKQTTAVAAW